MDKKAASIVRNRSVHILDIVSQLDKKDSVYLSQEKLLAHSLVVSLVPKPTHRAGHMLDLVISAEQQYIPRFLRCDNLHISDHSCVVFNLPQRKPPSVK